MQPPLNAQSTTDALNEMFNEVMDDTQECEMENTTNHNELDSDSDKHAVTVVDKDKSMRSVRREYYKTHKHGYDDDDCCCCLESYCCEHIFMDVICGCICDKIPAVHERHNKCCVSLSFIIILLSAFILMGYCILFFSQRTDDSFECEFCGYNYTTCFISNDTANSSATTVTLIYGSSNEKWGDMNATIDVNRLQPGFQTCLYSESSFTVVDYNQFGTSTASYLWSDNTFLWITLSIFTALFILCCCIVGCIWINKEFPGISICGSLTLLGIVCGAVLMVVGWPLMIINAKILDDIKLDCEITGISNIRFFELNCQNETICNIQYPEFGVVEYTVFIKNDTFFGCDIIYDLTKEYFAYLNGDYSSFYNVTNEEYYNYSSTEMQSTEIGHDVLQQIKSENSAQKCYQNIDSKQIVLDEIPSTLWFESPINNVIVIWMIVLGVLLICLPGTLVIFLAIGWVMNGCQ